MNLRHIARRHADIPSVVILTHQDISGRIGRVIRQLERRAGPRDPGRSRIKAVLPVRRTLCKGDIHRRITRDAVVVDVPAIPVERERGRGKWRHVGYDEARVRRRRAQVPGNVGLPDLNVAGVIRRVVRKVERGTAAF